MASSAQLKDEPITGPSTDERRTNLRLSAEDALWLQGVRIKYGAEVRVIDISAGGILVESQSELRPDASIVFEVSGPDTTMLVPARVLRCHAIDKGGRKRHQAACAFKRPLSIPELISPPIAAAPAARPAAAAVRSFPAAPPSLAARVIGQKVIARFLDGRLVRGYTNDFHATKAHLHLREDGTSEAQLVQLSQLKALFFVREFDGDSSRVERKHFAAATHGRKVEVTFKDGEVLIGSTLGYSGPQQPFFVSPADAESNNLRVFVPAAATRHVRLL